MTVVTNFDLGAISKDLLKMIRETERRGLRSSAAWAAELYHALVSECTDTQVVPTFPSIGSVDDPEFPQYALAKLYFDGSEYDRAAYFTKNCTSPVAKFLHYYSRYCSGEKKRLDDIADQSCTPEKSKNRMLKSLRVDLHKGHASGLLDGYCLYLYGLVLKKSKLEKQAIEVFCESIATEPLLWCSWLELSSLIVEKEMLNELSLPDHWIKNFFLAHIHLELQTNEVALEIYSQLTDAGFSKSTYIMAQIAIAYHNMRDVEKAIGGFQQLQKVDPFRLENMDIYSNLLYVREMRVDLSYLAHLAFQIDKYRVETCCIVGNFYSLRSQHEKAVLYFERALRLNPNYLSAWTLMGHEYMEMKNTSAAIQAYRHAIEVNRLDYRAWYGLGQTYEILKMSFYSLYYYQKAQQLRPHDSRMMVALGEAYEKLDKLKEAKKCYWKAHAIGDVEGTALAKLAKMYSKLGEEDQAAAAYSDYAREISVRGPSDRDELCQAYLFLAKYHFKQDNLEKAYDNAQQCMEFPETKEDAKSILRQITARRAQVEDKGQSSGPLADTFMSSEYLSPMNLSFTP